MFEICDYAISSNRVCNFEHMNLRSQNTIDNIEKGIRVGGVGGQTRSMCDKRIYSRRVLA